MLCVGIVASYSGIDGHWMWHDVLCVTSHIIILSHFLKWFLFLEKQKYKLHSSHLYVFFNFPFLLSYSSRFLG